MADVFISYAREDRDWVERLAELIERAGLSVWWDSRQRYGKSFEAQIVEELGLAKSVIVVWSKASLASDWVKDEAQDGRERGILMPILKDGVTPPLGFKQLHSADFTGWNGGPHRELAGVIGALRDLAGHAERTVAITERPAPAMPEPLPKPPEPSPTAAVKAAASAPKPAAPARGAQPRLLGRLLSTLHAAPANDSAAPARAAVPGGWRLDAGPALKGHDGALAMAAFAPDGSLALTAAADGTARVWDVRSGAARRILDGHAGAVTIARFSPDGARVVTGSADTDGRIWDIGGEVLAVLSGHTGPLRQAAFSPDGVRISTIAEDDMPWLWDARSGAALTTLQGHDDVVCDADFAPDGLTLVTAGRDAMARIWNTKTGRGTLVLKGHARGVTVARYAPDGQSIATGSADGSVRLWNAASGMLLRQMDGHGDAVTACLFSPDGRRLLTLGRDGTALLRDTANAAASALQGHSPIACAASVAGLFATGHEDGTLTLWDGNGAARATAPAHGGTVRSLCFAADGQTLISASDDKTARLWRAVYA